MKNINIIIIVIIVVYIACKKGWINCPYLKQYINPAKNKYTTQIQPINLEHDALP